MTPHTCAVVPARPPPAPRLRVGSGLRNCPPRSTQPVTSRLVPSRRTRPFQLGLQEAPAVAGPRRGPVSGTATDADSEVKVDGTRRAGRVATAPPLSTARAAAPYSWHVRRRGRAGGGAAPVPAVGYVLNMAVCRTDEGYYYSASDVGI